MVYINRNLGDFDNVLALLQAFIGPLTLLELDKTNYIYVSKPTGVVVEAIESNDKAFDKTETLTYTKQSLAVYEGYTLLTTLEEITVSTATPLIKDWLNLHDDVLIESTGIIYGYNGAVFNFKLSAAIDSWCYEGSVTVSLIRPYYDLTYLKDGEEFVWVPQMKDLLANRSDLPNFIQGLNKDWGDKIVSDELVALEAQSRISLTTGKVVTSSLGSVDWPVRTIKP